MSTQEIKLNICYGCMRMLEEDIEVCPYCGYEVKKKNNPQDVLPEGTVLSHKYLVGKTLGRGGFGVTYLGYDLDLQIRVAIKEYFPIGASIRSSANYSVLSTLSGEDSAFSKGCSTFLEEARTLAVFNSPQIVHVRDYFMEHGTAYLVMDFVDGKTLASEVSDKGGRLPPEELIELVKPLILQLDKLHKKNIIHRDIAPDNLVVVRDEESEAHLVLLDFGAARSFISSQISQKYTATVKHGYAPLEQYSQKSKQGPYTDVYALCATMYAALSGAVPPSALERSTDGVEIEPLSKLAVELPEHVDQAIMHGLALKSDERTQTMHELYEELTTVPDARAAVYREALALMESASSEEAWKKAAEKFAGIPGFRNADDLKNKCTENGEEYRKRKIYAEAKTAMADNTLAGYRKAEELLKQIQNWQDTDQLLGFCKWKQSEFSGNGRKNGKGKTVLIAAVLAAASFGAFFAVNKTVLEPWKTYKMAVSAYEEKNYLQAESLFSSLNAYKDASEYAEKCNFQLEAAALEDARENDRNEKALTEAQAKLEAAENARREAENALEEAEAKAEENAKEAARASEEAKEAKAQKEQADAAREEAEAKAKENAQEAARASEEAKEAKAQKEQADAAREEAEAKAEENAKEAARASAEAEEAKAQKEEAEKLVAAAAAEKEAAQAAADEAKTRQEEAEKQAAAAADENAAAQAAADEARERMEAAESQLQKITAEKETAKAEADEAKAKREEAEKLVAEAAAEIEAAQAAADEAKLRQEAAEKQAAAADAEVAAALAVADEAKAKQEAAEKQIAELSEPAETKPEELYNQAAQLLSTRKFEDCEKALDLFEVLGDYEDSPSLEADAWCRIGHCYLLGDGVAQSSERAASYYQMASDAGSAEGMCSLAECYFYGNGKKQDDARAYALFDAAAAEGNLEAEYYLGLCYETGRGTKANVSVAVSYYQLAADSDLPEAINKLGECYFNGTGRVQDYSQAFELFSKAADLGCADAQYNLAQCYEEGKGTDRNIAFATAYYQLASDQGNENAANKLTQ